VVRTAIRPVHASAPTNRQLEEATAMRKILHVAFVLVVLGSLAMGIACTG